MICLNSDQTTITHKRKTFFLMQRFQGLGGRVFHLACLSCASQLFTKAQLKALLVETRETNAQLGITGMLLYKGGAFLQVLEGEKETVMNVIHKLKEDPRHKRFLILLTETTKHRLFPDWCMAIRDLTDHSLASTPGFSDFLNTPFTGDEFSADPPRCMKLLLSFKKNM